MINNYRVTVNGTVYDVTVEETGEAASPAPAISPAPAVPAAAPAVTKAPAPAAPAGAGDKIEAPLNGTILRINTNVGAAVKAGDVLCVLEAMKMENDIVAPRDGKITSVIASKGASVNAGDDCSPSPDAGRLTYARHIVQFVGVHRHISSVF